MPEVTCTLRQDGTTVTTESVDSNSEAVSKNGALMKTASEITTDGDEFEISCER